MSGFLVQATILLAAAVFAVPLSKRLGLGSVLGYLGAGIVVGQVSGLLGAPDTELVHFAEFGVVMLLFVIGLEVNPETLWKLRHKLLGLGGLQVVLTTGLIAAAGTMLGLPLTTSIAVGMALALSSTAMVLQILSEKGLTQTNGGRSGLSVLLTQDVAVIPMLVIIPLLIAGSGTEPEPVQHGGEDPVLAQAFIEGLPAWGVAGVMLASIAFIILVGHFLGRPLFRYISSAGLMEISTAATLLLVVSTALLMTVVGLSPALGTFLAGVVLANSEFRHEMQSNIEPFKGLLLGLFFIMVGVGINFVVLFDNLLTVIGLTLGMIALKAGVLMLLAHLFRLRGRDRWLFTLGLAQAGEFGFVLLIFMTQTNVISVELADILMLVVAMSMILTPALFITYEYRARRIGDPVDRAVDFDIVSTGPVIIAGVGRFGQVVNDFAAGNGIRTTVLDSDIRVINMMRRIGVKAYLGDPTRPELLEAAGISEAKVLVIAIDMADKATELVKYARRRRPDLTIIARAFDRIHAFELYQEGATHIVRETLDSSVRAGRYVLQKLGIPEDEAHQRARAYFRFDQKSTRELALVWDPDIPIDKNEIYIQRLRELNMEMNLGLIENLKDVSGPGSETIRFGEDGEAPGAGDETVENQTVAHDENNAAPQGDQEEDDVAPQGDQDKTGAAPGQAGWRPPAPKPGDLVA